MKLRMNGALGDEIAMTAVVREYKRKHPDEMVRIWRSAFPEVWHHNPNLRWGNADNGKLVRIVDWFGEINSSIPHLVARQLDFVLEDDTPEIWLTPEERDNDFGLPQSDRLVAIDTWAGQYNRRWQRFPELAKKLTDDGWIVIEVGRHGGPRIDCAMSFHNKLSIRQTASLLANCALYVGNDSGLFHMAASVGTPQVVVFGPTPWYARAYWNTLGVFSHRSCAKACGDHCVRRVAPGGPLDLCVNDIPVKRLQDAVGIAAKRWLVGLSRAPHLELDNITRK